MSVSFQTKVSSRGFHTVKNTIWENVKMSKEISVQTETNEVSKKTDPYYFTMKPLTFRKLGTVGHIWRKVSRHFLILLGEEGGYVDDSMLSIRYRLLLIPIGGFKIR